MLQLLGRWAALACVLAVAVTASTPHDVNAHPEGRSVTGIVLTAAPVVTTSAGEAAMAVDHARCAYVKGAHASQGGVGWVVPIDEHERTFSHTFDLSVAAPGTTRGAAVIFYSDLGECPGSGQIVGTHQFWYPTSMTSGPVPADATHALIVPLVRTHIEPKILWCYALAPWCVAWVGWIYGSAGPHGFTFSIR